MGIAELVFLKLFYYFYIWDPECLPLFETFEGGYSFSRTTLLSLNQRSNYFLRISSSAFGSSQLRKSTVTLSRGRRLLKRRKVFSLKNVAIASHEFSEIKIDPRALTPHKRFLNAPKASVGLLLDCLRHKLFSTHRSIVSGFMLLLKAPLCNYEVLWATSFVDPPIPFFSSYSPRNFRKHSLFSY